MHVAPAFSPAGAELRRYEALLRMMDSITRHRKLEELFPEIARMLREVTDFEFITFNLHDPATNEMFVNYSMGIDLDAQSLRVSVEASPSGWVWQHQSVLMIADVSSEAGFSEVLQVLRAAKIESYCCVPLTTARRRWGAVGLGSRERNRCVQTDVHFLQRVGDLVAIATESASTFNDLEQEKERLQALLEVNASLVSNFDLQQSFPAISGYIRKVVKQDFASISLYDESAQCMRKFAVDYPSAPDIFAVGDTYSLKESHSGRAFLGRETIVAGRAALEASVSPVVQKLTAYGIQSVCCIPLITRKGPLGSLNFGSKQDGAFSARDVGLLKQIAAQLSIALDNARAYNEIAALKDKLSEEKLYLQGEIRRGRSARFCTSTKSSEKAQP